MVFPFDIVETTCKICGQRRKTQVINVCQFQCKHLLENSNNKKTTYTFRKKNMFWDMQSFKNIENHVYTCYAPMPVMFHNYSPGASPAPGSSHYQDHIRCSCLASQSGQCCPQLRHILEDGSHEGETQLVETFDSRNICWVIEVVL